MDMQMMIWAAILAVVAVVMIARTFGKARETVVSNDHIFDGETGQRDDLSDRHPCRKHGLGDFCYTFYQALCQTLSPAFHFGGVYHVFVIPFSNHICIVLCSFSFGESCDLSSAPQVEESQIQRSFWNGTGVLHVLQGPAQLLEGIGTVLEPLAPEPVQLYESNKNCVIFDLPFKMLLFNAENFSTFVKT